MAKTLLLIARPSPGIETALPRLVGNAVFKWLVRPLRLFSEAHLLLPQMLSSKQLLKSVHLHSPSSLHRTRTMTNRGCREGKYELRVKALELPSCTTRPGIYMPVCLWAKYLTLTRPSSRFVSTNLREQHYLPMQPAQPLHSRCERALHHSDCCALKDRASLLTIME